MTDHQPPQGRFDGIAHRFPVRVYYEDTDAGGIVYHASYLRFAERARSEFLRTIGWPHERILGETGCLWAVRRLEIDYRWPARLDDSLVVETSLVTLRGASMTARQIVRRGGTELATLMLQLVLLTTSGRPARLPPALRQIFLPLLEAQEGATDPCPSIP